MRVTAGMEKGRRLKVPSGRGIRPTSDKVKQALFNILGQKIEGARFLDLFAGAGGIGIEALSRGAERVVFVDYARASINAVRHNLEQTEFGGRAHIVASKAESYVRKTSERFDIIFLDPPYSQELVPLLELVAGSGLLAEDGIAAVEHFKKQSSPKRAGSLQLVREAVYGDTVLAFYTKGGTRQEEKA